MMDINQAENILKQVYLPVIQNQLNNVDAFIGKMEKTTKDVYGKEILVPVLYYDSDVYINFVLKEDLVGLYCTLEFYENALKVAETSRGAFVNLLNSEVKSAITETIFKIRSAVYDKDSCPIYLLKAEKPYSLLVLNGIENLFDDAKETYCGVDKKKYKLSPKHFKEKTFDIDRILQIVENENSDIDTIICSTTTANHFKVKETDIVKQESGYYSIVDNKYVVQPFRYIRDDEIFFVNSEDFKFHQLCDWVWLENEDGKILRKDITGKPIYSATLVKYGNIICHNPNNQIKITIEPKEAKGEKDE